MNDQFLRKNYFGVLALLLSGLLITLFVYWFPRTPDTRVITIGAGSSGGDSFHAAKGIARIINEQDLNINLLVLETQGTNENIRLLQQGLIDFGTVQADAAITGEISVVAKLFTDVIQIIKQKDLQINTFSDLQNKRIAIASTEGGEYNTFSLLSDHYNLSSNDFNIMVATWNTASWSFLQNEIDAIFKVRYPTNPSLKSLISKTQAEIIPIQQASAIGLRFPVYQRMIIPQGIYSGKPPLPANDMVSLGIDRYLVARQSLDEDLIYQISEVLFEKKTEFAHYSSILGFIEPPDRQSFIPVHQGTEDYMAKKEPSFFQENAELLALALSVIAVIVSGLIQVINNRKRRKVHSYNERLLALKYKIERSRSLDDLARYRDELNGFVGRVVEDAMNERITSAGFEFFSFTWGSVRATLEEKRQKMLGNENL